MYYNVKKNCIVLMLIVLSILLCAVCFVFLNYENSVTLAEEGFGVENVNYLNIALPSSFNANNITDYVPLEALMSNEFIIDSGTEYGYIIKSTKIPNSPDYSNHVLIFKPSVIWNEINSVFSIKIQTIHEGKYYVNGNANNEITESNVDYHIAIGNVKTEVLIINNEVTSTGEGAFFSSVDYNSSVTRNTGAVGEQAVSQAISISIDICEKVLDLLGPMGSIWSTITSGVTDVFDWIEAVDENWETTVNKDEVKYFPLTKNNQIQQNGFLNKSIETSYSTADDEYVLTASENEPNYLGVNFRIQNEDEVGYYVFSKISFDVYEYTNISFDRQAPIGQYSMSYLSDYSTPMSQTMTLEETGDDKFEFNNNIYVFPAIKSKTTTFIPTQSGYYTFLDNDEYSCVIQGVNQETNGFYLVSGQTYTIGVKKDNLPYNWETTNNEHYSKRDFYEDEVSFVCLMAEKSKEIPTEVGGQLVQGLSYKVMYNKEDSCCLYSISNLNSQDLTKVQIYICDSNFNILNVGYISEGKVCCNYPMKANTYYCIVVKNTGESNISGYLSNLGNLSLDNQIIADPSTSITAKIYYEVEIPYKNLYTINGYCSHVYDIEHVSFSPINNNEYYLLNKKYYIETMGASESNLGLTISSNYYTEVALNQSYSSVDNYNDIYSFECIVPGTYSFNYGTICDVFSNVN